DAHHLAIGAQLGDQHHRPSHVGIRVQAGLIASAETPLHARHHRVGVGDRTAGHARAADRRIARGALDLFGLAAFGGAAIAAAALASPLPLPASPFDGPAPPEATLGAVDTSAVLAAVACGVTSLFCFSTTGGGGKLFTDSTSWLTTASSSGRTGSIQSE